LEKAPDEAPNVGWVVADMKRDWKVIYSFQKRQATSGDHAMRTRTNLAAATLLAAGALLGWLTGSGRIESSTHAQTTSGRRPRPRR
jgi:hypothetical protein